MCEYCINFLFDKYFLLCLFNLLLSCVYYYYYSFESFQSKLIVCHWILSDSKSPHISRTLLSTLTDLNNDIGWVVSTCSPISKSTSPFTNTLGIVSSAPITTDITTPSMFHRLLFLFCFVFLSSPVMSTY